ncbi:MAG: type 1 glutamine amidotransferase [Patescibacteria group bacterium]
MQKIHPKILLICSRARKPAESPVNSEYALRFSEAMDIPLESFHTIFTPDEPLPKDVHEDAVIIGGSKHSVYEKLDWIPELENFVRKVVDSDKPFLGVCFGHQIIAQALGGQVERAPDGPEIGIVDISLVQNDKLFIGVEPTFRIGTFHQDLVTTVPTSACVLASNDLYTSQALSYGDRVRTVQFHPEFTSQTFQEIIDEHAADLIRKGLFNSPTAMQEVLARISNENFESFGQQIARNFYQKFILDI